MKNRNLIFFSFVLVVFAQLFVPAKMILDRENTIKFGKEYKFKVAPIDPNDPFKGKYVFLRFVANEYRINDKKEWKIGDDIYVSIKENSEGYVTIKSVSKTPPINQEYVKATVQGFKRDLDSIILIKYPFERFYMEESKAPRAEVSYRELVTENKKSAYALVSIKDGKSVLKDVLIDDISINELSE